MLQIRAHNITLADWREMPLTKTSKKTKYLIVTNMGPHAVRLASRKDELAEGYLLKEGEKFILDIDTNRAEYIELDKVYVCTAGTLSCATVHVTYVEEISHGND